MRDRGQQAISGRVRFLRYRQPELAPGIPYNADGISTYCSGWTLRATPQSGVNTGVTAGSPAGGTRLLPTRWTAPKKQHDERDSRRTPGRVRRQAVSSDARRDLCKLLCACVINVNNADFVGAGSRGWCAFQPPCSGRELAGIRSATPRSSSRMLNGTSTQSPGSLMRRAVSTCRTLRAVVFSWTLYVKP